MDARIKTVIATMEESLSKRPRLRALAKSVNLSPTALRVLFRRETNQTPLCYFRQLRMLKAQELLLTTFLSVKEVTYLCGAGDVSHFVRDFKMQHGMTPTQFRARGKP